MPSKRKKRSFYGRWNRLKFRHEYKHRINLSDMYGLRARLLAVAMHDPHAEADGTYFIKSLYFDNYMDKIFQKI